MLIRTIKLGRRRSGKEDQVMTETTGSSELEPRSGGSDSPAEPTPNAEQSGGERDAIDLVALLAHGVGPGTLEYLARFNLDAFIAGGNPWPSEKADPADHEEDEIDG